jgi:4-amino-4-deoxy-L-arabinose transferase-like glycosyltransferase
MGAVRLDRRSRQWIAGAALLGLVLRLGFGLIYWNARPLTRDEREYLSLARSLVAGDGYVYDREIMDGPVEPFGRAPGYSVFLALSGGGRDVVTEVPASVKIVQSFIGAFGVLVVGGLAFRMAGATAARAAALLAACYPPLVWIAAYALSEALFWPLGLLLAWSFDRAIGARARAGAAAFGVGAFAGLVVLIRAATMVSLPIAGMWLLFQRRLVTALAMAAGLAAVLLPWALRNYEHHGRFVLVASDGGVTFWTGNHPQQPGDGDMAANPWLKADNLALRARHPGLSEEQMEPIYYREAFTWIGTHPLDWIKLEARKAFYLVVPIGPSYRLHSPLYFWASVISYGLLLPVAVAGFVRLGRSRRRTPGLWLMASAAVGVCLVFFPQERFRIPTIDPTLVLCAGAAFLRRAEAEGVA